MFILNIVKKCLTCKIQGSCPVVVLLKNAHRLPIRRLEISLESTAFALKSERLSSFAYYQESSEKVYSNFHVLFV